MAPPIPDTRPFRPEIEDERCPTCGARQAPTDVCRRCKSDLRLVRSARAAYKRHRHAALAALADGRPDAALAHARRCQSLRPGPGPLGLLAVCQLQRGDWPEALDHARAARALERLAADGDGP